MNGADDLDAVFAAAGAVIAEATFTDTYTIKRPTTTTDGRGGTTITTSDIETGGKCALWANQTQSREYISGQRIVSSADYLAELPLATTLTQADEIEINGRRFNVTGVKRDGDWATSVIAELEARA